VNTIKTGYEQGRPIDVTAVGHALNLGSQPNKVQCFRGAITEIVVVSPVTRAETMLLDDYLLTKHAKLLGQHDAGRF